MALVVVTELARYWCVVDVDSELGLTWIMSWQSSALSKSGGIEEWLNTPGDATALHYQLHIEHVLVQAPVETHPR